MGMSPFDLNRTSCDGAHPGICMRLRGAPCLRYSSLNGIAVSTNGPSQVPIEKIETILTEINLAVSADPGNPETTAGERLPIGGLQILSGLRVRLCRLNFGVQ